MLVFLIGLMIGVGITATIMSITNSSVRFEEVENKDRKLNADPTYWILSTSNEDYLFTKEQLVTAKNRALSNPEDIQE